MGVSKNRGKTPKMDKVYNGRPYEQMDDLGGFSTPIFGNTHIHTRICIPALFFLTAVHPTPPNIRRGSRATWNPRNPRDDHGGATQARRVGCWFKDDASNLSLSSLIIPKYLLHKRRPLIFFKARNEQVFFGISFVFCKSIMSCMFFFSDLQEPLFGLVGKVLEAPWPFSNFFF